MKTKVETRKKKIKKEVVLLVILLPWLFLFDHLNVGGFKSGISPVNSQCGELLRKLWRNKWKGLSETLHTNVFLQTKSKKYSKIQHENLRKACLD